jgi:hypothetical protein
VHDRIVHDESTSHDACAMQPQVVAEPSAGRRELLDWRAADVLEPLLQPGVCVPDGRATA